MNRRGKSDSGYLAQVLRKMKRPPYKRRIINLYLCNKPGHTVRNCRLRQNIVRGGASHILEKIQTRFHIMKRMNKEKQLKHLRPEV